MEYVVKLFVVNSLLLSLFSCVKEKKAINDFESGRIQTYSNRSDLDKRIVYLNKDIESSANLKSASSFNYKIIAEISAPRNQNGNQMSASNIDVLSAYQFDSRAFVAYHTPGEEYGGGVDVINVNNESKPYIESSVKISDTDINDAKMHYLYGWSEEGERLWSLYLAGDRNLTSSGYNLADTKGAIFGELVTVDGKLSEDYSELPLPGFSANSIQRQEEYIFASTGFSEGGTYVIGVYSYKKNIIQAFFNHKFGKAVAMNQFREKMVVALEGGANAKLHCIQISDDAFNIIKSIEIGSTSPDFGKASLEVVDDIAYVAMGANGVKAVDLISGEILNQFDLKEGNCNNLCIDRKHNILYLAYGSVGLVILDNESFISGKSSQYSMLEFDGSANGVDFIGEYLFVSSGSSGVKIIERSKI